MFKISFKGRPEKKIQHALSWDQDEFLLYEVNLGKRDNVAYASLIPNRFFFPPVSDIYWMLTMYSKQLLPLYCIIPLGAAVNVSVLQIRTLSL